VHEEFLEDAGQNNLKEVVCVFFYLTSTTKKLLNKKIIIKIKNN